MSTGKVIKGDGASEPLPDSRPTLRSPRPGVVDAEVYEAHQSAQAIVDAAKQQAQEILQCAQVEKETMLAQAREQGRQEGWAQVTEQILRAKLLRTELLANAENEIVELACRIAGKILGKDLEREPGLVVELCATAIENVRTAQQVVVRVHPKDAAILRDERKRLMELIGRVKEIAIKEDPEVACGGGCIVETDSGTIDAQLVTQLEMLRNVLLTHPVTTNEGPA